MLTFIDNLGLAVFFESGLGKKEPHLFCAMCAYVMGWVGLGVSYQSTESISSAILHIEKQIVMILIV
jgi:hypothetical protein